MSAVKELRKITLLFSSQQSNYIFTESCACSKNGTIMVRHCSCATCTYLFNTSGSTARTQSTLSSSDHKKNSVFLQATLYFITNIPHDLRPLSFRDNRSKVSSFYIYTWTVVPTRNIFSRNEFCSNHSGNNPQIIQVNAHL